MSPGTWFETLQLTTQVWQPMHRVVSMTIPYCFAMMGYTYAFSTSTSTS